MARCFKCTNAFNGFKHFQLRNTSHEDRVVLSGDTRINNADEILNTSWSNGIRLCKTLPKSLNKDSAEKRRINPGTTIIFNSTDVVSFLMDVGKRLEEFCVFIPML